MSTQVYRKRLLRLKKLLRDKNPYAAALVSSPPPALRSRETSYPFSQSSNLYYLTGLSDVPCTLLVFADTRDPLLVLEEKSKRSRAWLGPHESVEDAAQLLTAEVVHAAQPVEVIFQHLQGVEELYYDNVSGSIALKVVQDLIALLPSRRRGEPARFAHIETILEQLRLQKDKVELALMRQAATAATQAFYAVVPLLKEGMTEEQVKYLLFTELARNETVPAFQPIVACGLGSAYPHYSGGRRVLKKGMILQLDWGAEYRRYQSDMARVVPVGPEFSAAQRDLYSVIQAAQAAALHTIRAGVQLQKVNGAAIRVLTQGLKDFGMLKGSIESLIENRAYMPFFLQDGVCHSIGLDVQDDGYRRREILHTLKEGMVLTVEPGLYFSSKTPPGLTKCGMRIEDMVVVTKKGYEFLTPNLPRSYQEVEQLRQSKPERRQYA